VVKKGMKKIKRRHKYMKRGFLADVFGTITNKNPAKKYPDNFKDDRKLGWNIYGKKTTSFKDHIKRFNFIHFTLKYKILVPLLSLASRLIDRYLDSEVPKENYNTELMLFNDSYENAIEKWKMYYIRNISDFHREKSMRYYKKDAHTDMGGCRCLRTAKDVCLTMALNDTAYREFIAIWVHELTQMTLKQYKDSKNPEHIFYGEPHIHDTYYYYLHKIRGTPVKLLKRADKED
jgi:hypothetical protein